MSQNGNSVASRLGGGIVEISAVATLLGAPISEAMTLGLKSASGLPWASITICGLLHVAKVSLAAAVPDWLREPLGLQNDNVNAAIGTLQEAISSHRVRTRIELGDAKGVLVRSPNEDIPTSNWQPLERARRMNTAHAKCIYRTDRSLDLALGTVVESEAGKPILVHEYKQDYGHQPRGTKEVLVLFCSLCKLAEAATLKTMGSNYLWFLSCIPWLYGLASAVILFTLRLSHDRMSRSNYDALVGRLPLPLYAGGPSTVICGIPRNVRRTKVWRLVWIGYFPASMVGLIGTFLVLGGNSSEIVFTWIGFQAFWLLLRTVVFYFTDNAAGWYQSLPIARTWEDTPVEIKRRTMQLILALAGLQASQHPRGIVFYSQDVASMPGMISLLGSAGWTLTETLEISDDDLQGHVYMQDVANDNILRCINWIHGATLPNNELYDSCLAFVRVRNRTVAVPAVRVSTCRCEHGPSRDLPRGDSHVCAGLISLFWIPVRLIDADLSAADVTGKTILPNPKLPASSRGWLYAYSFDRKAPMTCLYLTATDLDERLRQIEWQISLTKSTEFDQIVQVARSASALLLGMMKDLCEPEPTTTLTAPVAGKNSFVNDKQRIVETTIEYV